MPTDGLTLVGFLTDPQHILGHLRIDCVPPTLKSTDADLLAFWRQAQAKIGAPIQSAEPLELRPPSSAAQLYLDNLVEQSWVRARLAETNATQAAMAMPPPSFQWIEIDPLLALQLAIDVEAAQRICKGLSNPPTEEELLNLCLPSVQPEEKYFMSPVGQNSNSVIVKIRSHSLMIHHWGIFDGPHGEKAAGVTFRVGLPFIHIVRFKGRCFLHNGFHRAYGASLAGATHIPCIFRDVPNAQAVGIRNDGGTFSEALTMSDNPPRLAHFSQGRASAVRMRLKSRVIHVAWQQYSVPDEYDLLFG